MKKFFVIMLLCIVLVVEAMSQNRGYENGHEWVDLGLSVKWATCNVGASSPSDWGNYYAWGETTTKTEYWESNSTTYKKNFGDISGDSRYDAARRNWGGSWRLPTKAECQELVDNCTWTWTTQGGHNGYRVTSKKNGNSIFLPAAGCRYGSSLCSQGQNGYYWSSTPNESGAEYAYVLYFDSSYPSVGWIGRYFGHTVRPVLDAVPSYSYVENALGVNMTMIYVPGGTFTMGATSEQGSDAWDREKPTHSVTVSSFYMGQTEVTQAQWKAVMGTTIRQQRDKADPSYSLQGEGDNYPMYYVSHDEAQDFCRELSRLTGKTYRLPTEAEWEYAARGGKSQGCKYSGSYSIDRVAWYGGNSGSSTHPVGQKSANELGLYDMSGNVWEWCSDWYGSYSSSSQTNPKGAGSGSGRVLRGGSWSCIASYCRVSNRNYYTPSYRIFILGFRVVCVP